MKQGQIIYFSVCRNGDYQIYAGKITKVKTKTVRLAVPGGDIIERQKENVYESFKEIKKLTEDSKKEREQW